MEHKYAVAQIADQTWLYLSITYTADGNIKVKETVKHSEATLFNSKSEANDFLLRYCDPGSSWIEEVLDVEEFCSREDTW